LVQESAVVIISQVLQISEFFKQLWVDAQKRQLPESAIALLHSVSLLSKVWQDGHDEEDEVHLLLPQLLQRASEEQRLSFCQ